MAVSPDVSSSGSQVAEVIVDAVRHSRELFRAELDLAKAELQHELRRAGKGLLALLLGAGAIGASVVVVVVAAVAAFGAGAEMIGATGVALATLGGVAAWWGQRRLAAPTLERTRGTIARSAAVIREVE
jgi:uncharacterized membrane protein YqjE